MMRGRKLGCGGRIGWAAAVILAAGGCSGGGDLGAMSGQQALAGRDFADVFFWKERTLAFTRDTADPAQPEPQDLWVWPLDEPAPTAALTGIDWTYPKRWPVLVAGDQLLTGTRFERAYDLGERRAANLLRDAPAPAAPDNGGGSPSLNDLMTSTVMRSDGRGFARALHGAGDAIVVGRPSELRTFSMPAGGTVGAIGFIGADLALLLRQTTDAGDVAGLFRLDTSSGGLAPLVAPTAASEWSGITGFCQDAKPPARCGLFGVLGCGIDAPSCPDGQPMPCLIVYAKVDPDAAPGIATYVHDVGAGTTTKLSGLDSDRLFTDQSTRLLAWGSTKNAVTSYWNVCSGLRGSCAFAPGPLAAWRPDGAGFAMYGSGEGEGLRIVNVADSTCIEPEMPGAFGVYQVQFSPASDRLLWVAATDQAETTETLFVAADANGQAPAAAVSGPWLAAVFSEDGQRIYVDHVGESSNALGWVDPAASPPSETVLSTNFGPYGLLGNRRALFVDHFNRQDDNGELVLVDLTTGARESLAHAVTDVAVARGGEAEGTDVAYSVRGRASSARDGLWLTKLPP
jgi:hypothetical protein